MRRASLALFPLCILLSACVSSAAVSFSGPGGKTSGPFTFKVVDSKAERTQGLMGKKALKDDEGMLFVFKDAQPLQFWMKDTLIPLQILFFEPDGSFVNAVDMIPCTADPCPIYRSAALAQYALEVNPGFREREKIGVGWKMDISEVLKVAKPE